MGLGNALTRLNSGLGNSQGGAASPPAPTLPTTGLLSAWDLANVAATAGVVTSWPTSIGPANTLTPAGIGDITVDANGVAAGNLRYLLTSTALNFSTANFTVYFLLRRASVVSSPIIGDTTSSAAIQPFSDSNCYIADNAGSYTNVALGNTGFFAVRFRRNAGDIYAKIGATAESYLAPLAGAISCDVVLGRPAGGFYADSSAKLSALYVYSADTTGDIRDAQIAAVILSQYGLTI